MAIQKHIPNYLQGETLVNYILSNYWVKTKINDFLILKRQSDVKYQAISKFPQIPATVRFKTANRTLII